VVPNGVDSEGLEEKILRQNREEVRSRYSFTQEDIVILSLSRLRPSKGIHYLITAFQKAKREIPNLKLLIGGGGDESYQKELEQQCQDLSIMKEVRFLGNISQIEEPLRAADIFAAPYTSPEGFGLSVLEALTARLPVVASDIDGLAELLEGGELGVLFEEKNVEALKKALIQLAGDADLRQALALKGAKSCRKYSSHRMAENIQKIYEQVHRRAL